MSTFGPLFKCQVMPVFYPTKNIPAFKVFANTFPRMAIREKMKLLHNAPIILFFAHSFASQLSIGSNCEREHDEEGSSGFNIRYGGGEKMLLILFASVFVRDDLAPRKINTWVTF